MEAQCGLRSSGKQEKHWKQHTPNATHGLWDRLSMLNKQYTRNISVGNVGRKSLRTADCRKVVKEFGLVIS